VPATMTILGEWNWWAPRPLRRLHQRVGLSEAESPGQVRAEAAGKDEGSAGTGDEPDHIDLDAVLEAYSTSATYRGRRSRRAAPEDEKPT